jgi:hypothetical protein
MQSSSTNNSTTDNQNVQQTTTPTLQVTQQPSTSSQQIQQEDQSTSSLQQVMIPRSISTSKFEEPLLIPPLNFANKMNFPFLKKCQIKTIVYALLYLLIH